MGDKPEVEVEKVDVDIEVEASEIVPLTQLDKAEAEADDTEERIVQTIEVEIKPLATRLREVFIAFLPLGLIAFGGPAAHIGVLHTQFVEKYGWLDDDRFVELLAVGQGLPGPTSTQMVIAVGASHGGVLGGILAFMLWNVPSFIVLTTVALVSKENLDPEELPNFLQGLPAAAISLVFIAAYKLGIKVLSVDTSAGEELYVQNLKIFLASVSTVVTLLVTGEESLDRNAPSIAFPALLVWGGLITLFDSRREGKLKNYFRPPNEAEMVKQESVLKSIEISPMFGIFLILIWLGLLGAFIGLRASEIIVDPFIGLEANVTVEFEPGDPEYLDQAALLFESMFRMGSIIYGGGQVVLPMLLEEVVDPGWVSEAQFFQGFSLVQALPGPLFNFSSYLGASFLGLPGAFVAWAGLFGPGLLLILAFLPFWLKVRRIPWFKCFLAGVNAAAIGLLIAATAQLWEAAVETWADAATFFFTGAFIYFGDPRDRLPNTSKVWVPIGVILGGLFGWALVELDFAQTFE